MQYQQRSDGRAAIGAAGLLKRSMAEMANQQQIQKAIHLRSVNQMTYFASPSQIPQISAANLPAASTSSILSSVSSVSPSAQVQGVPNSTAWSFQGTIAGAELDYEKKSSMTNRLLELQKQLLDDEEEEVSISDSAVTSNEWSETMEKLMSPPPPLPPVANLHPLSPSPTTSSSSSSGSCSSCTPSSATPSRQMLLDTAIAITEGNQETATANLAVLKGSSNPRGDPDQRLTAMMVAALVSRIKPLSPGISSDVCSAEHQAASHLLYEASPCFKLGLMAANLAILEATKDSQRIHILDFDIGQGSQLASLIHAFSERHRHTSPSQPPPCLKITSVSPLPTNQTPNLRSIGERLAKLAERLGVALRFNIVNNTIQDLNPQSLLCEPNESLAVNFAFFLSRVPDESVCTANPRDELLRRVKSLSPVVVTLAEQEMNGNTAPFATRFSESIAHFGALLDSLDATASRESAERARVEACLARKAANSIAREGSDRVERCELYGKWRARMGMAGFDPVLIGPTVSEPVKLRLSSLRNNPGFTLKEEASWLGPGWLGRVLTVASAWR